ncbi:unnamed protein product [Merluccius merluccius]
MLVSRHGSPDKPDNMPDATKSPQCSAMRRRSFSVWAAPRSSASQQEGRLALQKDALSDENSTSVPALAMLGDWYQTLDKQHCPEQTEQEYTKGENLPRSEGGED